jgi:hypothetical protein
MIRDWRAMEMQVLALHDLEDLDGRAERLRVLRTASLSMLREYRECEQAATPNKQIQRADEAAGKLCDLIEQYYELHGTEEQLLNYKEYRAWYTVVFHTGPRIDLLMLGQAIEERAVGGPDYFPGRGLSRSDLLMLCEEHAVGGPDYFPGRGLSRSDPVRVIGLYKTKDKQTVRAVFKGPKGGIYTKTPSGSRSRPKNEDWEPMEEAEVKQRIAQHEAWKSASPSK